MLNLNPIKNLIEKKTETTCLINLDLSQNTINEYRSVKPFPHIFINNFVRDLNLLDEIIDEYQSYQYWGHDNSEYSKNHQVKKYFSPWCDANVKDIPKSTKKLIDYLNSDTVLKKLETLTGIQGLMADPMLEGGGMHRIDSGGKLSVHADYNKHPNNPWYRRINLLIYLNKNWQDSWGGDLQLWNEGMTVMEKSSPPTYNTCVIFNTTPTAYHGHPHALNTPDGISRYSIAMYYFTKDRPENEKDNSIAATWKEINQNKL
jgi:Rps23 Pro-64 3,4-dihydroxylase Tpa1-like proline 4-hydroxylase